MIAGHLQAVAIFPLTVIGMKRRAADALNSAANGIGIYRGGCGKEKKGHGKTSI